jgi:hypothetical protein
MNIRATALGFALLLAAGSAAMADDMMAGTYGNTVMTKSHKTGGSATLYFNQDMTYTVKAMDPQGKPVGYGGTWALKDGGNTLCLTPQLPPNTPGAGTSCSPLSKHAPGDSWTTTNDMGETFDVSLSAGR